MATDPLPPTSPVAGLGTRLRHLVDQLDAGVATFCPRLGVEDYRPRYTPVVRALLRDGPCSIRDIARAVSVTHSAASQTVTEMSRRGFVALEVAPTDARQRLIHLTDRTRALLPALRAEWDATEAAREELEAELSFPLTTLLGELESALARRPFQDRIAAAIRHTGEYDDGR
jgi:DNA-binding MarR family transcriptional regulator